MHWRLVIFLFVEFSEDFGGHRHSWSGLSIELSNWQIINKFSLTILTGLFFASCGHHTIRRGIFIAIDLLPKLDDFFPEVLKLHPLTFIHGWSISKIIFHILKHKLNLNMQYRLNSRIKNTYGVFNFGLGSEKGGSHRFDDDVDL